MISFELVFGVKMKFKYWALILMPILTILPATGRDTMRGITTPLLTFPFGNDNQGGVSAPPGEYAGQPVVAGAINPYTGNATRVVNELSVPSVGEVGLNWTRYHNTRPNSGTAWFGSGGNWRHSYQWDFSYYLPVGESKTYNPSTGQYVISGGGLSTNGRIVLVYPNGTTNTFYETGPFTGIYTCSSSQVTDYIILDGASNVTDLATGNYNYTGFKLINSNNQVYHFSINVTSTISSQPSSFLLSSITDSKGQATTLSYNVSNNGIPMLNPYLTVTEPGGRYLQVNCTQLVSSSGGFGGGTTYTYPITSVVSSDSRTITFNYTTTTTAGNNGSTLYLYALTSVNYPESVNGSPSTSAAYTYGTFSWPAQLNPSLLTAKDTHAVGIPQTQYNYWPINLAPPVGSVESITEMASNSIVSTVGVVSADNSSLSPVALFPDQSGYVYNIQSTSGGLLQQTVNYTNNTNNVSYSSVSGALTTDPNFNFGTSTGTFTTTTQNSNTNSLATTRSVLGHILSRTWPIVPPETVAPSESWSYNNAGYLLSYTDTRTKTTTITRDPTTNLITSLAYPDNTTESFTYGAFNEVATHTRRNGGTEIYTYYTTENSGVYKGLLKSVQDAAGGVTSYAYDAHYRVSSVTNANLHTTSFSYDAAGRILTVTNPATTANPTPTTRSYTYDNYGNILTFQNEDLKTWRYTYDGFNRLLTTLDPVGRGFTYTYDPNAPANASPIQVTNTLTGKITFYTYLVNWGYKVYTATTGYGTPYAATTTYAYDPDGNVSQVTDPRTNNTKLYYDQRDRVSSAVDPASNTSTFSYDDASNLTDQVTPDGRTHNDYDAMNRLLDSTDPKLQEVKMTYDPEGALQTYQESNGATYSYTYDADERQLTMKYPDASAESYTYYALGNMHTYKTRDGRVQTVTYDERERQLNSSWNDGVTPAVSYTYDNASYLASVSNTKSAVGYTYTDAGEVHTETQTIAGLSGGKLVGYSYNNDGLINTLTYPDGTVLTYGYNSRNDLTSIQQGSATVCAYNYDAAGNRTVKNLANGVNSTLTYDAVERLSSIADITPTPTAGTTLQSFNYGYDPMSRWHYNKKQNGFGDVYSYDPSGQVSTVLYGATNPDTTPTNPQRTVSYYFDAAGNRTSISDKLATESTAFTLAYSTNADNQYTNVGIALLGYDARGNLATYQERGSSTTHVVNCTYDAQNLLLSASNNFDTTSLTQAYDPLGRCVKRIENGVTTYFVYDTGWNLLAEYNSSGTQQARYVGGAATDEILTKTDASGNVLYYHTDGLGSVTKITNATGAVVESYTYDIFGNPTISNASGGALWTSAVGNRFLFTGREYLYSLGVYDYRTRIYDPYLGRFWQPDSIGHGGDGSNLHRYCGNDPINNTDPFGTDGFSANLGNFGNFYEAGGGVGGYFPDPYSSGGYYFYYNPGSTNNGAIPGQFTANPAGQRIYGADVEAARIAQTRAVYAQNSTFGAIASNAGAFVQGFSDPTVRQQSAAATLNGLDPFGTPFTINDPNSSSAIISQGFGQIGQLGFGGAGAFFRGGAATLYSLRALRDGYYPVMAWGFSSPVGSIFLKAGEVWKYGKTINPTSRYTQRFLISTGLYFKAELMGSEQFVLSTERKWILRYLNRFGKLPPGNKAIK